MKPVTIMSELPLKLARKSIDVLGSSSFDEESGNKSLSRDFDDEIVSIVAGKEFGLVKSSSGKVNVLIFFFLLMCEMSLNYLNLYT